MYNSIIFLPSCFLLPFLRSQVCLVEHFASYRAVGFDWLQVKGMLFLKVLFQR